MIITVKNWKNKKGADEMHCKCNSWKQHWMCTNGEIWPNKCSFEGCDNNTKLGTYVINTNLLAERIIPVLKSCTKRENGFHLKIEVSVSATNTPPNCENLKLYELTKKILKRFEELINGAQYSALYFIPDNFFFTSALQGFYSFYRCKLVA
jgi:hypothetical protein